MAEASATATSSAITARNTGTEMNRRGPRVSFAHTPSLRAVRWRGRRAAFTRTAESTKAPAASTKMPAVDSTISRPAAMSGLTGPSSSVAIRDRASERV